eukprot:gene56679-biopygen7679
MRRRPHRFYHPDGGLFVPHSVPRVQSGGILPGRIAPFENVHWARWARLPYADLAYEVMRLYIDPAEIPDADLRDLARRSYATNQHCNAGVGIATKETEVEAGLRNRRRKPG